jgi:hypothetical protein
VPGLECKQERGAGHVHTLISVPKRAFLGAWVFFRAYWQIGQLCHKTTPGILSLQEIPPASATASIILLLFPNIPAGGSDVGKALRTVRVCGQGLQQRLSPFAAKSMIVGATGDGGIKPKCFKAQMHWADTLWGARCVRPRPGRRLTAKPKGRRIAPLCRRDMARIICIAAM